jgi:hypothetical protein
MTLDLVGNSEGQKNSTSTPITQFQNGGTLSSKLYHCTFPFYTNDPIKPAAQGACEVAGPGRQT